MGAIFVKKKLTRCNKYNTPLYQFNNKKFYCKVVDVYDGDTITIVTNLNNKFYKYKVRMYGYDSPELKPRKNIPNRDEIITKAKEARTTLRNLILDKIVVIEIGDTTWDKYGRLIGTIYMKINNGLTMKSYNTNINKFMIDNNYGYEYFGGTKKT